MNYDRDLDDTCCHDDHFYSAIPRPTYDLKVKFAGPDVEHVLKFDSTSARLSFARQLLATVRSIEFL